MTQIFKKRIVYIIWKHKFCSSCSTNGLFLTIGSSGIKFVSFRLLVEIIRWLFLNMTVFSFLVLLSMCCSTIIRHMFITIESTLILLIYTSRCDRILSLFFIFITLSNAAVSNTQNDKQNNPKYCIFYKIFWDGPCSFLTGSVPVTIRFSVAVLLSEIALTLHRCIQIICKLKTSCAFIFNSRGL